MKNLLFIFLAVLLAFTVSGQTWEDNLPQEKLQNGELQLQDFQTAFNDYWDPYNVEGGYYYINGEKIKAPGWKLFKRWEWMAEYYTDGDGNFPETSTSEEMDKYNKMYPDANKSITGNWSNIGYNQTPGGYDGVGRVNTIAFHPSNSSIFWIGTPSGGMWKTTDGGSTWTVLTDGLSVMGVSAILVHPSYNGTTNRTLYIGTGDRDGNSTWTMGSGLSHDSEGVGVLISTDGGTTWSTTGLSFVESSMVVVNDLLIHPTNNNTIYAATSNGLYKTTDGGTTWPMINTGDFIDLEFKPGTPARMYGARKYYWGEGSIWLSTDGGSNWSSVSLPGSSSRRTELAVSAANSNIVYALTVNSSRGLEGVYKSTNSGSSFSLIYSVGTTTYNLLGYDCTDLTSSGQGSYDLVLSANPANANEVYAGGINIWKTINGGTSWSIASHWQGTCGSTVTEVHADQHCCEFNGSTVYFGNDGGIYKSTDAGGSWSDISNGLTINQIYRIGVSQNTSNDAIIGLQDNGTHQLSGGSWNANGVIGGDGMECLIDPVDEDIQFGEHLNGDIRRTENKWTSQSNVRNLIRTAGGNSGIDGAWVTPFILDPNNRQNLFVGYDELWKSTDQGTTSTNFSQITVSSFTGPSDIKSIQIAPSNSNYIYVSYDSYWISNTFYYPSSLHRSTDGGSTWTDITGSLPVSSGEITYICVKNNDHNTVWVTFGGFNSHAVYQTTNAGTGTPPTWTNISTGLPQIPAMSIVQNIQNTSSTELYVSMSGGVWMKNGSSNWAAFNSGLPSLFCSELDIYYDNTTPSNSKIRVGTFGRGLWETPLPAVDFSANNTMPTSSMTQVGFTDLSTNSPTGWFWTFNPATVTYVLGSNATSQNPLVQFNNPGAYTVTLTTTNAFGNNAHTKTTYIHMGTPGLWTGTTGTDWNTGTNWHNHLVPLSSIGVAIHPGPTVWPVHTGDLTIGTHCASISMAGNSELTVTGDLTIPSGTQIFCNANSSINVDGDFINYGTFTPGTSVVKMTGNTNSSIIGNTTNNGSQTTTFAGGTGYNYYGAYFDIVASGGKNISVDSFNIHCIVTASVNVEVWYTTSSYVGNTSTPSVWTQLGTTQTITGSGWWNPTSVNPGASVQVPIGATYGFYINCYSAGSGYLRINVGPNNYSNSDITINAGFMSSGIPVGSGGWSGNTINATVYYSYVTSNPLSFYDLEINKTNALVTSDGILTVGNDLTVSSTSNFTNNPGNSINVVGNMTIKADATGMASFLDNGTTTINGSTSVEEYLTSQKWHLVSPPLSGATINTYFDIYLKQYNEPTDTWTYLVTPTTTPMNQAQGYSVWASDTYTGTTTVSYNGSLTNNDIPVSSLSYTSAASKAGFNLLGNPFPCALDWNSNWTTSNLSGWMVIYDNGTHRGWHPTSGAYNGKSDGVIPSTQGFWVRALNSSGSLTIPASERIHSSQAFYKDTPENVYPTIRLESEINDLTDETVVLFHPDCSSGFDGYYDLSKFTNIEEAPTLYTISSGNNYGVNFYDESYMEKVIPVGFKTGEEGLYSISASEINYFGDETNIYLEDLKTGTITKLTEIPIYDFTYDPLDEEHRFNLHFKDSWYGIEDQENIGIKIYAYEQVVYVRMGESENSQVKIFDIMGKEIVWANLENNSLNKIPVRAGMGYYLVKIQSNDKVYTQKIFLK